MKEQKDMSGVLFPNDRKEQDKHPDRKGSATINGMEYWISGWLKEGSKGKFMSLAFTPKEKTKLDGKRAGDFAKKDADIPW